jgi:hypothetical protein
VCIVGVPRDETVFRPADNSRFMDVETSGRFRCRQHAAVAKSVVARAKCVTMDEIGDAQGGETSAAAPGSGRSAGTASRPQSQAARWNPQQGATQFAEGVYQAREFQQVHHAE